MSRERASREPRAREPASREPGRGPARGGGARPPWSEGLLVIGWLAADLLSIPFHLLRFLLTRTRHRREFQRALKDAAP